jgi:6-methylsalicylic acid synthase
MANSVARQSYPNSARRDRVVSTDAPETVPVADPRTLLHKIAWRPYKPVVEVSKGRALVIVGAHGELSEALAAQARAAGRDCRLFNDSEQTEYLAGTDVCLMLTSAELEYAESHLRSLSTITRRQVGYGRVWCLTTGAVHTGLGIEPQLRLDTAAVAGFGRTLAVAQREVSSVVVDLDDSAINDAAGTAKTVLGLIGAPPGDAVIAVRQGQPLVARLTRVAAQPSHPSPPCRPESTYLVSGGHTQLGLTAANRLADLGAERILFVTPSKFNSRSQWESMAGKVGTDEIDGLLALEGRDVTVRVLSMDITDPTQAAMLADPDRTGLPPVRGVLSFTEPGFLGGPLRARGTQVLHELFPPRTLDFFTIFSSGDHLLNLPGSELDGVACIQLDAVVTQRAQAGEHAMSLGVVSGHGITAPVVVAAWDVADRRGPGVYSVFREDQPELLERELPVLSELGTVAEEPV